MKILVVEDSRAIAQVMIARLKALGHDVVQAENGVVAVELFQTESPDLVLMDIEMPVMNGFEAANRIRTLEAQESWSWTPIIFLTSTDTVENLVTSIEAGGDDFMSKFVPEPVLKAKMKAMARIATMRHSLLQANQKLQRLADHDGLTGLMNRRNLDARSDVLWAELAECRGSFALLMMDIDNFKKYNDHYGHQAGDDCLRRVAKCIEETVEGANMDGLLHGAFAARYGGEEFTVVIPLVSAAAVQAFAMALVEAVRGLAIPHQLNAEWGVVTISIGGVHIDPVSGTLADCFKRADARLYTAKHAGRNRAVTQD